MNSPEPTLSSRPTKVEVPKELPKDNMVNTSLKKLKHHLAGFEVIVKERTTATAITEGSWGFEHTKACLRDEIISFVKALKDLFNTFDQFLIDKLSEVQNVFHQMEQAVEQHLDNASVNVVSNLIAENKHLKQTYKKLYDSIKPACIRSKEQCDVLINQVNQKSVEISDLNAKIQEQGLIVTALKDELRKLKGKDLADNVVCKHTIDLEMLKIDVEYLNPRLLNNMSAHSDYLKHTQEEAAILREIVEQRKSQNPLNESLDSSSFKLNANSEPLCVKCNGCMLSDNHDLCVLDFINDRPTGWTFTLVGNACPLTRTTTTTEVPFRKPTTLENEPPKPIITLVYSRKPRKSKTNVPVSKSKVLKSVSANKKEPSQSWGSIVSDVPSSSLDECRSSKLFSVKFVNDHVAKILGYDDYHIRNVTISRVYYVEGLGHNLFSVGKFCDSNLEVSFCQHTCFIRNLEGVDLLTGSQGNNLYTLSLGDMMASSPICLLSKASKTKSWLWHRRLSHLNFGAINHLARHGLVRGLPKLKFEKDHLCSACAMGKSKKKPHKPKSEDTNQEKLYLLHMDLCGPMRVASVNGKKYILVIVDDYSRFTWVKCLRSKDEAPDFIIKFLKMIQVRLKVPVRRIRTDNGTEFVNQTLREYYEKVGISHETSVARSPQQNGVVERRNRTLIEAARTMLIYAKAPLFLWAEAVATACYTQNRSIIRLRHGKTPYELLHDKPPTYQFYPKVGISHETYVARSPQQNGVVKRRNRTLIEAARTMLIYAKAPLFLWAEAVATACYTQNHSVIRLRHGKKPYELLHDKLPDLSFFRVFGALCYPTNDREHLGKLQPKADIDFDELTAIASKHSSSGPTLHEMTPDLLFQPLFDELLTPPPSVDHPTPKVIAPNAEVVAPKPAALIGSPSSTTVDQDAPSPNVAHMNNDPFFGIPIPENDSEASSSHVIPTVVHTATSNSEHIEAMQEELHEFERLKVWELVPRPDKVMVITLKWIYKVKLDEMGGILKNKARLVARGYRQEEGIDFE
ncbi:retrovirus-related pol polyprotein from transposon TNT 1-94 [Tanacetum coccineum]|uniref:Retrovirus-related pol polyprotein from transposon TNT 1-94 n=1 Tax=Tanacetum coccineum TaxID=301880 RepID=A0ABQ5INL8_9ASTR